MLLSKTIAVNDRMEVSQLPIEVEVAVLNRWEVLLELQARDVSSTLSMGLKAGSPVYGTTHLQPKVWFKTSVTRYHELHKSSVNNVRRSDDTPARDTVARPERIPPEGPRGQPRWPTEAGRPVHPD